MSYCGTFVNRPYHVFSVTQCKGAKNALDRLRKDTSRFHIMITKRNLLDMELLQKVEREMNLFVIGDRFSHINICLPFTRIFHLHAIS